PAGAGTTHAVESKPSSGAAAEVSAQPAASEPSAQAPATPAATTNFEDGFVLRSADGNYSFQPGGFLQARLEGAWPEHGDHTLAFLLPRARAGFKGTVFDKNFRYTFLADFGRGTVQLSYFYGDY